MNLSIINGTETLVQAPVTAEQAHYILNYLGHTYVDPTTKEPEKPKYRVEDINDIAVVRDGEVIMPMERLIVGNVTWDANTDTKEE